MNLIEKTTTYKELMHDYKLQCLENNRKQDRIIDLQRKLREKDEYIKELETKIEILESVKKRGRKKND